MSALDLTIELCLRDEPGMLYAKLVNACLTHCERHVGTVRKAIKKLQAEGSVVIKGERRAVRCFWNEEAVNPGEERVVIHVNADDYTDSPGVVLSPMAWVANELWRQI